MEDVARLKPLYIPLFGIKECLLALLLVLPVLGVIYYKSSELGYSISTIGEQEGYSIHLVMEVLGNGRDSTVKLTLPINSERQVLRQESQVGGAFLYSLLPGRIGEWSAENLDGQEVITYSCFVQTRGQSYSMPVNAEIPTSPPFSLEGDLRPTHRIQSEDPDIIAMARRLVPQGTSLAEAVEAVYNFTLRDVRYMEVRGPTDAVTALSLREASCNGKVRLMTALLRACDIPARVANGLILEKSRKRTSHAWVEVWVDGHWVPFCPTNGFFAEIPAHYLELAKGDVAVMTRTRNIGFDWIWTIRHQLSGRERAFLSNADHPLNILRWWTSHKDYAVSIELIMIILLIPIAATVVCFTRNVVGVVPYGTFMPALIAVSFRETGFIFGTVMFTTVIVTACLANFLLKKLHLLHIPRLTIIITLVVMSIIALSIVSIQLGYPAGAAVSLFPMAILSLTTERFTETIETDGPKAAFMRLGVTYLVSAACFLIIGWDLLQLAVAAFPELLIINVAINLVIGSYTGLRLTEIFRFRLREEPA